MNMRQVAKSRDDQAYRLRLDPVTLEHLRGIAEWLGERELRYSDSVLIRSAIREYLRFLQETTEDFTEIVGRIELASGVKGRRIA